MNKIYIIKNKPYLYYMDKFNQGFLEQFSDYLKVISTCNKEKNIQQEDNYKNNYNYINAIYILLYAEI